APEAAVTTPDIDNDGAVRPGSCFKLKEVPIVNTATKLMWWLNDLFLLVFPIVAHKLDKTRARSQAKNVRQPKARGVIELSVDLTKPKYPAARRQEPPKTLESFTIDSNRPHGDQLS